jgi:four helix bundle protein
MVIGMQSKGEKSKLFEVRLRRFAIANISISRHLPISEEYLIIRRQLIRSSTSVGANYVEANNASSKADFRNKIFIAKKETAETRYWLEILSTLYPKAEISAIEEEASQLLFIFQSIISTMKNAK